MIIAVLVDTLGWGASGAIPFDARRLVGLLLMGLAAYLLLPRG